MRIIAFFIFFLVSYSLFSCINVYRTKLSGEVYYGEPYWVSLNKLDSLKLENLATSLLDEYNESKGLEVLSDYAVILIYQGKYQKAKSIYFQIENDSPNLYTTASNLGTIYELIGKPDSAYFWINKSIEINPNSHHGSEWIHLKILDYKTSKDKKPGSILGLDFGDELIPKYNGKDIESLEKHLNHQLQERLQFINSPNYIMGNLFFDFGNVLAINVDLESAIEAYNKAKEFGYDKKLMDDRIKFMSEKTKKTKNRSEFKDAIKRNFPFIFKIVIFSIIALIVLILIFIVYKRKV